MLSRYLMFGLDELGKTWLALSAGVTAVYCVDWRIQAAVMLLSLALCLLCGAGRVITRVAVALAGLAGAAVFFCRLYPEAAPPTWAFFGFALKFGPFGAMAVFLGASLNVSRLLRALERLRLPASLVVLLGACLRFLPSVAAECRQIGYAMRTRGMGCPSGLLLRGPLASLGYLMVPLLLRSLAVGEELARAAVTRGVERPGPKTSYHDLGFGIVDWLVMAGWTVFLAALIVLDTVLHGAPAGRV